MDMDSIEIRMGRATTLPIFSNVVSQVLALTENSDASARQYEQIIMQDTALTAKILRTANTAYYGGSGKINTLPRALSQLGSNTIRSICLTVAFQSALCSKQLNARFDAASFWQHSIAVACAAKVIACLARPALREEAFTAGLVHDLGKLALCMFLPVEASQVYRAMETSKISQYEAERILLEITHQEIGRVAAERWSLPEIYYGPISSHHTPIPETGDIDSLTAIVHVGNALAHTIYPENVRGESAADPRALEFLNIPEAQYQPVCQAIAREVARMGQQMGM